MIQAFLFSIFYPNNHPYQTFTLHTQIVCNTNPHSMKNTAFPLLTCLLIITALVACNPQETDITTAAEFETYLQEEMEDQHIPAMSVLVFQDNEILYEQYLGQANREQNLALTEEHLFLLASVSKVVTATALLQLHDAGAFALDDPINQYLPFAVNSPYSNRSITFRHLLTHTSGIADGDALDDQYYYGEDSPIALRYFLENYLVPGGEWYDEVDNYYDFAPGTEHEYSNVGSALIGVLVEQISNQEFKAYCQANIFAPLGMDHTFWSLEEAQNQYTLVQPYNYRNRQYEPVQHYTFTDYPNGGLRCTAQDLHVLLSALAQGGMFNGVQLLAASTVQEMMTPQITSIDPEVGLHLFLMNAEQTLWGHDGGEEGVATIMAFNPSTHVGAIILCNQGDANLDEILVQAYKFGLKL